MLSRRDEDRQHRQSSSVQRGGAVNSHTVASRSLRPAREFEICDSNQVVSAPSLVAHSSSTEQSNTDETSRLSVSQSPPSRDGRTRVQGNASVAARGSSERAGDGESSNVLAVTMESGAGNTASRRNPERELRRQRTRSNSFSSSPAQHRSANAVADVPTSRVRNVGISSPRSNVSRDRASSSPSSRSEIVRDTTSPHSVQHTSQHESRSVPSSTEQHTLSARQSPSRLHRVNSIEQQLWPPLQRLATVLPLVYVVQLDFQRFLVRLLRHVSGSK